MSNHDPLGEGEETEIECDCGKNLRVEASYSITYYVYQCPCLNGEGEHQWEQINGYPKELFIGKFRCKVCNNEKTER